MSKPSVTAVIIARSGSQRLPGKNMLDFHGKPLVAHKAEQLSWCQEVDNIVVGSDSADILAAAKVVGADVLVREPRFCDEVTESWNEVIYDMASRVTGDIILWAHCTNPCIMPLTYDAAVRKYITIAWEQGSSDSLIGVNAVRNHAWWAGRPLNFDPYAPAHQPARNLHPIYFQNGGIFIASRALMMERKYVYGEQPILFPMDDDESTDIDTLEDYQQALRVFAK